MKKISNIYIVDQDNSLMSQLEKTLLPHDIHLTQFSHSLELLHKMEVTPDLIILDFKWNGRDQYILNGHEAVSLFEETFDIPVILCSDNHRIGILDDYRKFRGLDYFLKSDNINWISDKIIATIKRIQQSSNAA